MTDRQRSPRRTVQRPPARWQALLPLGFVVALLIIVMVAASTGGGAKPRLTDVAQPATTAMTTEHLPSSQTEPTGNAPSNDGDLGPTDDPEVLGTVASPEPTVRLEDLPTSGNGEFAYAAAGEAPYGTEPYRRFAVAVEQGAGVDADGLAAFVDQVLSDQRSWVGDGVTGFRRVGEDEAVEFTLVVATPATVDQLCAPLQTSGRYSCGANGWIALNLHRWMTATPDWPTSLDRYRHYLVNHEVGHYVLGPDHPSCPEPGAAAPIMMQQTIDLGGCRPNGWVFPRRS